MNEVIFTKMKKLGNCCLHSLFTRYSHLTNPKTAKTLRVCLSTVKTYKRAMRNGELLPCPLCPPPSNEVK